MIQRLNELKQTALRELEAVNNLAIWSLGVSAIWVEKAN